MDVSGKSRSEEYGHQEYFDRLRYISVYAKHVIEDEQNPKLLAEQRRRAFFETAARYLRDGKNLVICAEGICTVTEKSPLPLKAGAFPPGDLRGTGAAHRSRRRGEFRPQDQSGNASSRAC